MVIRQERGKDGNLFFFFFNVVREFVAFFLFLFVIFLVTEKNRTVHCPAEAASTLLLAGLILHGSVFQDAARIAL